MLFLALFENIKRTSSIDGFVKKFNKVFLKLHRLGYELHSTTSCLQEMNIIL